MIYFEKRAITVGSEDECSRMLIYTVIFNEKPDLPFHMGKTKFPFTNWVDKPT